MAFWRGARWKDRPVKHPLVKTLEELASGPLYRGDLIQISSLALCAEEERLVDAVTPLVRIVRRFPWDGVSWEMLGRYFLLAISSLQTVEVLWDFWWDLWKRHSHSSYKGRLLPLVLSGLRLCDPPRALQALPELIRAGLGKPWLGQMLLDFSSFRGDFPNSFLASMKHVTKDEEAQCIQALRDVGVLEEDIRSWLTM